MAQPEGATGKEIQEATGYDVTIVGRMCIRGYAYKQGYKYPFTYFAKPIGTKEDTASVKRMSIAEFNLMQAALQQAERHKEPTQALIPEAPIVISELKLTETL